MKESFESFLPANDAHILKMSTDEGKAFKKKKVQNIFAMCYFKLSLDSPNLLKMIKASKSLEWPSGLACDIKKRLNEEVQVG